MELVAIHQCQAHRRETGFGVVGIDMNDGDIESLRQIARMPGGPGITHVGGKAHLVIGDDVDCAAGPVPAQRTKIERLGHHALTRERRIAVNDHRQRHGSVVVRFAPLARCLFGAGPAIHDRSDELEVAGVGGQRHRQHLAAPGLVGPLGTMMVLHISGAAVRGELAGLDVPSPFEFGKDRFVGATHGVGQHIETAAVGHADHDLAGTLLRGQLDDQIEHGHQHVHALDRESLLTEIGLMQELLERLDLHQSLIQPLLVGRCQWGAVLTTLDHLPQPDALGMIGDVLQLVGHRAAVGFLQARQRLGQRFAGAGDPQDGDRDSCHGIGVEAEGAGIQSGIADRHAAERVEVRGQVSVGTVGFHQRHCRTDVEQVGLGFPHRGGGGSDRSADHRLGQRACLEAQAGKGLFVEVVGALQQVVHRPQEFPRLRALDHAMIVGAGDCHDLRDPQFPQLVIREIGERRGVADGTHGDDAPLARHQPRHGGYRTQATGIGQRERRTGEGVWHQLVGTGPLHQRLIDLMESGEVLGGRVMNHRDHQAPAAVLALDIHRDPQVDATPRNLVRRSIDLGEDRRERRVALRGLGDRPANQVGERHLLRPPGGPEGIVQLPAADFEHRHCQVTKGGRGRNRPAFVHIGDEACGSAGDQDRSRATLNRRGGWGYWCGGSGGNAGGRRLGRRSGVAIRGHRGVRNRSDICFEAGCTVLEVLSPLVGDGGRVPQVLLIHDLGEAGVRGLEQVGIHGGIAAFRGYIGRFRKITGAGESRGASGHRPGEALP